MYVTYPDLIQFCIFIVALVSLIFEISKGRK
ncbi:MAG: putative holin-like toxin [Lachnospiraceae bacterium]